MKVSHDTAFLSLSPSLSLSHSDQNNNALGEFSQFYLFFLYFMIIYIVYVFIIIFHVFGKVFRLPFAYFLTPSTKTSLNFGP